MARGITAGDGQAVAQLFDVPLLVIGEMGEQRVMLVDSAKEVAAFFGSGKEQYNQRGITDTRADVRDLERVGDNIVIVAVRWPYLDAKGKEIGGESSDYTLVRDKGGKLKIRAILMRGVENTHS